LKDSTNDKLVNTFSKSRCI